MPEAAGAAAGPVPAAAPDPILDVDGATLQRVYAGLRPPALRRYGETDDRWEELI